MEEIINIVIKVVAALLAFGVAWVGKWLVSFLKNHLSDKNDEKLNKFIAELVAAAEQIYKNTDPDGTIRFRYVESILIQAGYEITDAIKAVIEAKVFEINTKNAEKAGA